MTELEKKFQLEQLCVLCGGGSDGAEDCDGNGRGGEVVFYWKRLQRGLGIFYSFDTSRLQSCAVGISDKKKTIFELTDKPTSDRNAWTFQ